MVDVSPARSNFASVSERRQEIEDIGDIEKIEDIDVRARG
jgi:hypothetical protein